MQDFQEANANWENAYMHFLGKLGHVLLAATKAVLSPGGYVDTVTEFATTPVRNMVQLLVAPTLGIVICTTLLLWAI